MSSSSRSSIGSRWLLDAVENVVNLLAVFGVLVLLLVLEPVEHLPVALHELQQVHSIRGLLDFLELAVAGEHIHVIDGVLGVRVAPLEGLHA
jgi:hypothetical protein